MPRWLEDTLMAVGLLVETTARQAETLAYADAFLFMAAVGVVTLVLVPLIPPTPPAAKPPPKK